MHKKSYIEISLFSKSSFIAISYIDIIKISSLCIPTIKPVEIHFNGDLII